LLPAKSPPEITRVSIVLPRPVNCAACPSIVMFTSVVLRALKRELRDPPSDPPRDPAHIRLTIHEGMMCCALPSVMTREPMREAGMAFHPDGRNRNATRSTETVRVHIAAVIGCIALVC